MLALPSRCIFWYYKLHWDSVMTIQNKTLEEGYVPNYCIGPTFFFLYLPSPGLLPVLRPCEWYMTPTLDGPCLLALGRVLIWVCHQIVEFDASPGYFYYWRINTPYLDGIPTHQSRVKADVSPRLYLQATTAGSVPFIRDYLLSHVEANMSST